MRMARNIYHRKDGRFEGRYANGYDSTGKTRYSSVFARTYGECKERLERAKAGVVAVGQSPPRKKGTVVAEVTRYLETASPGLKPSTLGVYRRYLDNHIAPHFGNTPLVILSAEILQTFVNTLLKNGLSAKTAQSVFSFLRASIEGVETSVWDVKFPKAKKNAVAFFTVDEQKRLEAAAHQAGRTDYLAVMLCLYTGLRIGELCGLQYGDIDFPSGKLQVSRTMQRIPNPGGETKTMLAFLPPKSTASARSIPLPEFICALFRKRDDSAKADFVLTYDGKPIEPRTMQYRFKKICATAGVDEVNFHTTRHSFAVRALENGFDIKTLSEIMGHSSVAVTMNHYAHVTDQQKRHCMNALAAVYSMGGCGQNSGQTEQISAV